MRAINSTEFTDIMVQILYGRWLPRKRVTNSIIAGYSCHVNSDLIVTIEDLGGFKSYV